MATRALAQLSYPCVGTTQLPVRWHTSVPVRCLTSATRTLAHLQFWDGRGLGPAVYSRETATGYQTVLESAGFKEIEIFREQADFVSSDEETWWRMMKNVGWREYVEIVKRQDEARLEAFKKQVFKNLQQFKDKDGIHFGKRVIIASAGK